MYYYFWWLLLFIPIILFSGWASARVHSTYKKYDGVLNRANMTGYDTAVRLMRNRGVNDIAVCRVKGSLTDHYHPTKKQVNLSESTYGSSSVAAVAVSAHEIGHVMQKKQGNLFYNVRSVLVPIANIGSRLAIPLLMVGILLAIFSLSGAEWVVYVSIGLYGLSTLFTLVTLPVELNASRRAKKMLLEDGVLTKEELSGASKVLSAAAMTYVAALFASLYYFLRFLMIALMYVRRD